MGYRKRAGGGKRDAAEAEIIAALEAAGAQCWRLSGTGNPDVLVRHHGIYLVAEIKTGKGVVTRNQVAIPWPIWRSPQDGLRAIGVTV